MMKTTSPYNMYKYSGFQLTALVILRLCIGWHFLYEGIIKLSNPNWSAASFLIESQGLFSGLFQWMAKDPMVLGMVNVINMWMLILIGLCLIIGVLERFAYCSGILLLFLYYLAAPPWPGFSSVFPTLGNHLIIDRNLVEMGAIIVLLAFPTCQVVGLERLINKIFKRQSDE